MTNFIKTYKTTIGDLPLIENLSAEAVPLPLSSGYGLQSLLPLPLSSGYGLQSLSPLPLTSNMIPERSLSNDFYRSLSQCKKCQDCQKEYQSHLVGSLEICCECLPKNVIDEPYGNYNGINQNKREEIFENILLSFPNMYKNLDNKDQKNYIYCKSTLLGISYPQYNKELIYLVISNVPEIYKNKKNFWNGLKRLFGESCLENLIPEVLADVGEIKDQFFHNLDFL